MFFRSLRGIFFGTVDCQKRNMVAQNSSVGDNVAAYARVKSMGKESWENLLELSTFQASPPFPAKFG